MPKMNIVIHEKVVHNSWCTTIGIKHFGTYVNIKRARVLARCSFPKIIDHF